MQSSISSNAEDCCTSFTRLLLYCKQIASHPTLQESSVEKEQMIAGQIQQPVATLWQTPQQLNALTTIAVYVLIGSSAHRYRN
jgi:hypothetical protein